MPLEWYGLNFNWVLWTIVYWNYATHIVRVCVSSKSPFNPILPFTKKVIFKLNLVPELWPVYTNSYVIILSRTTTPCLKNIYATSLPDFLRIFLTTLDKKILITSQSDQLIHLFPLDFPTIQHFFLEIFNIVFLFYATPIFYHEDEHKTYKRAAGRERPTTQRMGSKSLNYHKPTGVGEQLQLFPELRQRPCREQPKSMPLVKWG